MEGYTQSEYYKFTENEDEEDDEDEISLSKKKVNYTNILKEEDFEDDDE